MFLSYFFLNSKGENIPSLKRASRALRYSIEIKKLVNMIFFNSMEYFNGEIKLLERAIKLLRCRTEVLKYFNTAYRRTALDFILFDINRTGGSFKKKIY